MVMMMMIGNNFLFSVQASCKYYNYIKLLFNLENLEDDLKFYFQEICK
jgi:hypothetical protein